MKIEKEIEIINQMSHLSNKYGFDFVLKLHPRDDVDLYRQNLHEVIIDNNSNTTEIIAQSRFVIGNFSTALFTAVIFNKVILIMNFGDILTDAINTFTEVGEVFHNMYEYENILKSKNDFDKKRINYDNFRNNYIGYNNNNYFRASKINEIASKFYN